MEVGDLTMILKSGNPPTNTAMRQMKPFLSNCNRKTPYNPYITRILTPKSLILTAHFAFEVISYQKLRGDDKNGKQLSFRYEFFEASPTV